MSTKLLLSCLLIFGAVRAYADPVMCDTSYENCRTPLLAQIHAEQIGIDVTAWFMEDMRYAYALEKAHKRGVPVRILMNIGWDAKKRAPMEYMRSKGLHMRHSYGRSFHPKAMLFRGAWKMQIGGGNYTGIAFKPIIPLVNYVDEVSVLTDDWWTVAQAGQEFDDLWTNTTDFREYSNAPDWALGRSWPQYGRDPNWMFLTQDTFFRRLIAVIDAECCAIDTIIYRASNWDYWSAIHRAQMRGVRVRFITEPKVYYGWRTQGYLGAPLHVAGVYWAVQLGAQVKLRTHAGLTHEKFTVFHGMRRVFVGSSNYNQYEGGRDWDIDIFWTPTVQAWALAHFERKWAADPVEFAPLVRVLPWPECCQ